MRDRAQRWEKLTFYTIVSVWCLLATDSQHHVFFFFFPGDGLYLKSLPDIEWMAQGLQMVVWLKKQSWETAGVA